MKYNFDYVEYNKLDATISPVEEKVIHDNFMEVVEGNDSLENVSSRELEQMYWIFRHGWICRELCTHVTKPV